MNADGETENGEEEETNCSQTQVTQVVVISISEFTKIMLQNFHCINCIGMTLVVCALACGAAVLALLVVRRHCQRTIAGKSCHIHSVWCHFNSMGAGPNARNVVYDEIVLPPTSSSSSSSTVNAVIPTEPNAAYATTTRVARDHHSS